MAYLQYLTDHVEQITIQNNEKFYVVSGELKAIKEAQNEIIETQNRNWELAEGQFKALRQNVHHMRNCIQYLYVREQINQHSLVLSNIFQAILANIKTYRCGKQLRGPNVHLRSDLTACDTVPAIRLDFQLPDPISTIFKLHPPLDDLPNFSSRSEAQIQILQQIQPEFKQMETRRTNSKSIEQMAEPILEIRAFKPELEQFLSFLISVLIHLTYSHLLHKWANFTDVSLSE